MLSGQRNILLQAFAALLLAGCTTVPPALPTATVPMPRERLAVTLPFGFVGFCSRFADQCLATPNGSEVLTLNDQSWALLQSVNQTVNHKIWQQSDEAHYRRAEYWTIPTDGYGDCEDYALAKRKDLIAAGLPTQALRLAIAETPKFGLHTVLTVVTDKGDFVLDNHSDEIRSWLDTGYRWLERQDGASPLKWVSLLTVYADLGAQPAKLQFAALPAPVPPRSDPVTPIEESASLSEQSPVRVAAGN
ncbi:MAG: transglutaminase-like cysteine peptidase [Rhizomicrobium sp.]|nr:transglutaminase-like cysteine peptidase [Rhizomicrobium sp.]